MDLAEMFRRKFLNTHEKYLKSISDVITHLYQGQDYEQSCMIMLENLKDKKVKESKDSMATDTIFRNLRNAWYHECAFYHPDSEERLLFAPWKIIQTYYAIYSAISCLIRCFHEEKKMRHDAVLNLYTNEFLSNESRKNLFLPPSNFILNQQGEFPLKTYSSMIDWGYAEYYHLPVIKNCLLETRKQILARKQKPQPISIAHYLKYLRDWVTYQDAYLFFRLYGPSVKQNIDDSMQKLLLMHLLQTECFLIKLFGSRIVVQQYQLFHSELTTNLGISPEPLYCRFRVYENMLAAD